MTTPEKLARSYVSNDNVQSLAVLDDRGDCGFSNVAWDKSLLSVGEISYATTLGYQGNSGGHMSLFPPQKNLEWFRPFTALGTAAVGERRMGRFLTQSLKPAVPGQLSLSQSGWGMDCRGCPPKALRPKAVLSRFAVR